MLIRAEKASLQGCEGESPQEFQKEKIRKGIQCGEEKGSPVMLRKKHGGDNRRRGSNAGRTKTRHKRQRGGPGVEK